MVAPALRMSFANREALLMELDANLQHGRAFVLGAHAVGVLEDCTLILSHPDAGTELQLGAQAVFVAPDSAPGVGVQLRPFDASVVASLQAFAQGQQAPSQGVVECPSEPSVAGPSPEDEPQPTDAADCAHDPPNDDSSNADVQQQPSHHERLRKLNQTQQQKIARTGSLNDRVLLERLYGRSVWEALLHNPKLTVPEVATIARKGSVPRPLLELIVENNTWIAAPVVRRALLGNPRVNTDAVLKLLRLTPKHELKAIHKTNTYSTQVREAARRVLENA